MTRAITAFLFFLLSGCGMFGGGATDGPRVTTEAERMQAQRALTVIETAVNGLLATGRLDVERHAKATQQIADLRQFVAMTAEVPTDTVDLMLRIANLGIAWIPPKVD